MPLDSPIEVESSCCESLVGLLTRASLTRSSLPRVSTPVAHIAPALRAYSGVGRPGFTPASQINQTNKLIFQSTGRSQAKLCHTTPLGSIRCKSLLAGQLRSNLGIRTEKSPSWIRSCWLSGRRIAGLSQRLMLVDMLAQIHLRSAVMTKSDVLWIVASRDAGRERMLSGVGIVESPSGLLTWAIANRTCCL